MQETWGLSLGREGPLKKEMATHSSIFFLENPMDRGAWWTTVHGVSESNGTEWITLSFFFSSASMGRNYKEEDFILMKDLVASRAVQNCGEWLCERVIFSLPRGLAGWGEVPDLAGRVSSITSLLFHPALSLGQVTCLKQDNPTLKFAEFQEHVWGLSP